MEMGNAQVVSSLSWKTRSHKNIYERRIPLMLKQWFANEWVRALGIFLVVLILLFSSVFFKGYTFGGGDTTAAKGMTHQLNIYHSETGEYPLWQPYIFSGMPAFSSLMFTKWIYFPNFIFSVFHKLGLPALWTMLLHYILAAMGAYVLLRHLKVDFLSAVLGGLAFMLTPFFVVMMSAGHGSQMMTAAYLPWLIYAVRRIFVEPDLKGLVILALVAGFQFQRGHVQIAYYGWMAAGWYVVIEAIFRAKQKEWANFPLSIGYLVAGLGLGIGLAAVQYLPSLSYTAYSIRGGSASGGLEYGYATSWSFPPYEMLALLFSDWFGFGGQTYWGGKPFTEHSDYLGLTLIVLMVAAFFNKEHFKEKIYLLSTILLALLVSFGSYWPYLYDILFKVLPFFNKFRVPSMILILLELMVALLAGLGLYTLLNLDSEKKAAFQKKVLIAAGFVGGIFIIALLAKGAFGGMYTESLATSSKAHPALRDLRVEMFYSSLIKSLFMAVISLLLIWAYFAGKIRGLVLSLSFTALVLVDLGHVDLRFTQKAVPSRYVKSVTQVTPAISKLKQLTNRNPGRIFPVHTLFGSNVWALHGLESIGGYSPAKLKVLQDFLNSTQIEQTFLPKYYTQTAEGASPLALNQIDPVLRKRHLDVLRNLNVKYLVSPYPMNDPMFEPVSQELHIVGGQRAQVVIYKFTDSYARAWFVPQVRTVSSVESMSMELNTLAESPSEVAIVLDSDGDMAGDSYTVGKVQVLDKSLQALTLQTQNEGEGFLVISEVFYPGGWTAWLDGETELEIFQTNELIRGVRVPAGDHEINFVYAPASVSMGFWITVVSVLTLLSLIGYLIYGQRKLSKED